MRKIFFPVCCASAMTATASSTNINRIDKTPAFLIASTARYVSRGTVLEETEIYDGRGQVFVEWENQILRRTDALRYWMSFPTLVKDTYKIHQQDHREDHVGCGVQVFTDCLKLCSQDVSRISQQSSPDTRAYGAIEKELRHIHLGNTRGNRNQRTYSWHQPADQNCQLSILIEPF